MKATIEQINSTETKLTISAEKSDLSLAVKQVTEKLAKKVKVPGFRPGTAPRHLVEREVGSEAFEHELIDSLVPKLYYEAIIKNNLRPIGMPSVQIIKHVLGEELEFSATIDVMPEIKLGSYKKIKKTMPKVSVDQKEVDTTLNDLQKAMAISEVTDEPAKKGFEVEIDFEGKKEEEIIDKASAKNQHLILGEGQFIDGFEDNLIGTKKGDKKTFTVTFPKDYFDGKIAGQAVEFAVAVKEVKRIVLPDIDDEFAKKATGGRLKTLDALKKEIRESHKRRKEGEEVSKLEDEIIEDLLKSSDVPAPKVLVESQTQELIQNIESNLAKSGLTLEQYLENLSIKEGSKKSLTDLQSELVPQAEKQVKVALILSEVAKQEGLKTTGKELDDRVTEFLISQGNPQLSEEESSDLRSRVEQSLMARKTLEKLVEIAAKK